jgi:NTP pyrophosphatase (non-canonical NTP hydrolase)
MMSRADMRLALQRIEEARNDQWAKWGPQDHDLPVWMTILSEEVGEVAKEILGYRSISHINGKDFLVNITHELAQTAAVCVAMMEAVQVEYRKLDGPRIGEFKQVVMGE